MSVGHLPFKTVSRSSEFHSLAVPAPTRSPSIITMFSRFAQPLASATRQFSTSGAANTKVAVMGASGGKD